MSKDYEINEERLAKRKMEVIRQLRDNHEDRIFILQETVETLEELRVENKENFKDLFDSRNRMSDIVKGNVEQLKMAVYNRDLALQKLKTEYTKNKELAQTVENLKRDKRNLQARLRRHE